MSRRSREPDSSLFPFLSVLACVIGTLTLLIAALAVGQVAESLLATEELDAEQEAVLATERAELEEIRAQIQDVEELGEEVAAARAELRALGVDPDARERDRQRAVRARAQAARLARQIAQLEAKEKSLVGSIQGVETSLAKQRPDDDDQPIRILPYGTARPLRPFFIEARSEGIRIYSDDFVDSWYLARGNIDDEARFTAFLNRVRTVRESTVIFLIRPDGIDTYRWASQRADRLLVRHAKLPLPSQGDLEFQL